MCDDDDGSPDYDLPALERNREIGKFGVNVVALCPNEKYTTLFRNDSNASSIITTKSNAQFRKIYLTNPESTFTIACSNGMLLCDLLSLLGNKRKVFHC